MNKYHFGASQTPPEFSEQKSLGYPSNGNIVQGLEATIPGAFWFYRVDELIKRLIEQSGQTLDLSESGLNQLALAQLPFVDELPTVKKSKYLFSASDGALFYWNDHYQSYSRKYSIDDLSRAITTRTEKITVKNGATGQATESYKKLGLLPLDGESYPFIFFSQAQQDRLNLLATQTDLVTIENSTFKLTNFIDYPRYGDKPGKKLSDAIRNIKGKLGHFYTEGGSLLTGANDEVAVVDSKDNDRVSLQGSWSKDSVNLSFDASKVVPTADENRPKTNYIGYAHLILGV